MWFSTKPKKQTKDWKEYFSSVYLFHSWVSASGGRDVDFHTWYKYSRYRLKSAIFRSFLLLFDHFFFVPLPFEIFLLTPLIPLVFFTLCKTWMLLFIVTHCRCISRTGNDITCDIGSNFHFRTFRSSPPFWKISVFPWSIAHALNFIFTAAGVLQISWKFSKS